MLVGLGQIRIQKCLVCRVPVQISLIRGSIEDCKGSIEIGKQGRKVKA